MKTEGTAKEEKEREREKEGQKERKKETKKEKKKERKNERKKKKSGQNKTRSAKGFMLYMMVGSKCATHTNDNDISKQNIWERHIDRTSHAAACDV